MAGYEGHRGWVNYLAVDPAYQGKGFGRQIMQEIEKRLLALGCPKINLQVRDGNTQALEFYSRIGYKNDNVVSLGKRLISGSESQERKLEIKKYSAEDIPLLEFDPDKTALIEPQVDADYVVKRKKYSFPEYCVMPIYSTLFDHLIANNEMSPVFEIPTAYEKIKLYELNFQGKNLVVVNPGIGAPLAAMTLEVMIALGCHKFMVCGSCGVLKSEIKNGIVIIPANALRDEGTSYHYLLPSRTVAMNPLIIEKLEAVLQKHHIHYEIGKTWTTDAIYRETKGRIAKLKEEGCIAVEMECAAFLSVAKFRDVLLGQYITASDDVSGDEWDRTIDHGLSVQEKLFWLSVEACLSL